MCLDIIYRDQAGYLAVKASGLWTERNVKTLIDGIKSETEDRNVTRVLLDLRGFSRPENEVIRYVSGEYLAKVLGFKIKVSVIGMKENINRFAETVALNRGARLSVTDDESAALQWLTEDN
jgi:hypothetical protein